MYNLRYHIASLVSVFFALAVGLLLGSVVVERGVLDRQRTSLVQSLEKEFKSIKGENNTLRSDRDLNRSFSVDAVRVLVDGELTGRTVLVVAQPGYGKAVESVREAVEQAGGEVVVATGRGPALGLTEADAAGRIAASAGRTAGDAMIPDVLAAIAAEWTAAGAVRPVTDALSATGRLRFDRRLPETALHSVVFVGGRSDKAAKDPLVDLAAALRQKDGVAVTVSSFGAEPGMVVEATAKGLSAVDHVDTPAGVYSLVRVLTREAEGHFGVASGAQAPYPKPQATGTP